MQVHFIAKWFLLLREAIQILLPAFLQRKVCWAKRWLAKAPRLWLAFVMGGVVLCSYMPSDLWAEEGEGLKIAVVDMSRILNDSKTGRSEKSKLLKERNKLQKQLNSKETEFKSKVEALRANSVLNEQSRQQEETKLRKRFQQLQGELKVSQSKLAQRERAATQRVVKKVEKIVQQLAKEEEYDLVLERTSAVTVLYARQPLQDITKTVIKKLGG